jgi:hypothetical protein
MHRMNCFASWPVASSRCRGSRNRRELALDRSPRSSNFPFPEPTRTSV